VVLIIGKRELLHLNDHLVRARRDGGLTVLEDTSLLGSDISDSDISRVAVRRESAVDTLEVIAITVDGMVVANRVQKGKLKRNVVANRLVIRIKPPACQ